MTDFLEPISDNARVARYVNSASQHGPGFASSFQPVRALEISQRSGVSSKYIFKDSQTGAELYKASTSNWKSHWTLSSSIDGSEVGSVKTHALSSKIDVIVRGRDMQITKAKHPKKTFQYTSPTYPGAVRHWIRAPKGSCYTVAIFCVSEKGETLAKISFGDYMNKMKRSGRLELASPVAAGGALTEEMIVTGLAVAQAKMTEEINNAVALVT